MDKGYSLFGHPGVGFKVRQMKDGKWAWEIKAWREILADGVEATKPEAEKALMKTAGKVLVTAAKKKSARTNLYVKLKDACRRRPFLSIFVLDAIVNDLGLAEIVEAAEEEEATRHGAAEKALGYPPFELHPLAKRPAALAETIWNVISELGWDRNRVDRFAKDYLGAAYSNPDGVGAIEVIPLKKKKQQDEE
jgi:hypothetical protein